MLIDNPFFMREVRQLKRRPRAMFWLLLGCLCGMAGVVSLWTFLPPAFSFTPTAMKIATAPPLIWMLMAFHTILCCYVAGRGAFRMLLREEIEGTLDTIVLLPYSALRWLALKAAFTIVSLCVVWLAALPFYMFAAVYNLIKIDDLLYYAHRSLLYGFSFMFLSLVFPYHIHPRVLQAKAQSNLPANQREIILIQFVGSLAFFALMMTMASIDGGLSSLPRFFYTTAVPEWALWIGALAAIGAVATVSCLRAIERTGKYERLKSLIRLAALFVMGFGALGVAWSSLPPWSHAITAVVLIAGFIVIARLDAPVTTGEAGSNTQRDDRRRQREVVWLTCQSDNPVFIRDIRVYVRSKSLLFCFLGSLGVIVILVSGFTVISARTGMSLGDLLRPALGYVLPLYASVWSRARLMWVKEHRSQSLVLLLLTSLNSSEILSGRLLAALAYHLIAFLPLAALAVAGLAWSALFVNWIVAPLALALSPLLVTIGIWMCGRVAPEASPRGLRAKLPTLALSVAQLLVVVACYALAVLPAFFPALRQLSGLSLLSVQIVWAGMLLLCFANIGLAWAWFRLRVRELETYRVAPLSRAERSVSPQPLRAFSTSPQFEG